MKKGDILFKIDSRPYDAVLAEAEADVSVASSHFQSMQDIYTRDVKSPAATPEATFIQDRDNREEAKATIARAKAGAKPPIRTSIIALSGRRLAVALAAATWTLATMWSPTRPSSPRLFYSIRSTPISMSTRRTLLRIGALLPNGKVPADAAKQLPLTLGLANEKPEDFTHKGTLKIADNKVDATTGTVAHVGVFDNSKRDLRPGLFVRVRMDIGPPQPSLFVTETALGSDQGRKYVYVVNDKDKVVYTQVDVGSERTA